MIFVTNPSTGFSDGKTGRQTRGLYDTTRNFFLIQQRK